MKKLFVKKVIIVITLKDIAWIDVDLQNALETITVKKESASQFQNNAPLILIVKLIFIVQQKDSVLINVN
jgi:hypothetical protein